MKTLTREKPLNGKSKKILKHTSKTPMEPEINSNKKLPNGNKDPNKFKTCTPLHGTTKSPKPNILQLPLKLQLTSSSRTHNKFKKISELPLKLTKISDKKLLVTSKTSRTQLHQPELILKTKLTTNGSQIWNNFKDLMFKSLKKLLDTTELTLSHTKLLVTLETT